MPDNVTLPGTGSVVEAVEVGGAMRQVVHVANLPDTQPVSAVALPLPTGAATEVTAAALLAAAQAIKAALAKANLAVEDVDLFELNEAFAAVGCQSMNDLGISDDIVNVNGGAIAIGHPVGVSGTRIVLTLLNELQRRGGGTGAAALCGGGGQGDAMIVRTV